MNRYFLFFLISIALFSCEDNNRLEQDISKININYNIERFDVAFSKATPSSLPELKDTFPFMFSKKYKDSFWIEQLQDTIQQELHQETLKAFKDFKSETNQITSLFQHLKYYFPEFKTPRVVTTTSGVQHRNKVVVTDSIVLVSLDTYLGAEHYFYNGIQDFIRVNLKREQLVVDLASKYANYYIFQPKRKTLLDELIFAGKQLYFKDKVIPFKTDAEKIAYSQEQLDWAKANEEFIWRHFVDKELLFSTDSKLPSRFINPGPFSKFYLEQIDRESPPRIGQYIGWQIVKAYMEKESNNVTFKQMLSKSANEIFNKSKFKPRR